MGIKILILDDDPRILQDISALVAAVGHLPLAASNVETANKYVLTNDISLAIVDLYLEGDSGFHLSNDFIKEVLIPKSIPYGRFTSAPRLVPSDVRGLWIVDKKDFYQDDTIMYEKILAI